MLNRRKLLIGLGVSVAVAGCSGSESTDQSDDGQASSGNNEETDSSDGDGASTEADSSDGDGASTTGETMPDTTLSLDNIQYGFGGLTSWIRATKDTTGEKRIQISTKAYSDGELIGEDSQYRTFANVTGVKLTIESVSDMGEYGLDDVTKFVVQGQPTDGETYDVLTFSNEELKQKIESTNSVDYGGLYGG